MPCLIKFQAKLTPKSSKRQKDFWLRLNKQCHFGICKKLRPSFCLTSVHNFGFDYLFKRFHQHSIIKSCVSQGISTVPWELVQSRVSNEVNWKAIKSIPSCSRLFTTCWKTLSRWFAFRHHIPLCSICSKLFGFKHFSSAPRNWANITSSQSLTWQKEKSWQTEDTSDWLEWVLMFPWRNVCLMICHPYSNGRQILWHLRLVEQNWNCFMTFYICAVIPTLAFVARKGHTANGKNSWLCFLVTYKSMCKTPVVILALVISFFSLLFCLWSAAKKNSLPIISRLWLCSGKMEITIW